MAVPRPHSPGIGRTPYVIGAVIILQTIDASTVAIALPQMAESLGVDPVTASLSITSYLVGMALAVPAAGWLADRFGSRNVFRVAMIALALASMACAAAPNFTALVIARFFAGIASSVFMPVGRLAVARSADPAVMVSAITTYVMVGLTGPLIGPFVGALLVQVWGWRAIFAIIAPLGLITLSLLLRYTRDDQHENPPRLDMIGMVLSGVSLASIVAAMELLGHRVMPVLAVALGILGLLSLATLLRHTRRVAEPLVRLDLLQRRVLRLSILTDFFMRILVVASPILMSLMMQVGLHYSALYSGALMAAMTVGQYFIRTFMHAGTRIWGLPNTMIYGGIVAALAFAVYGQWPDQPVPAALLLLALIGLGRSLVINGCTVLNFIDIAPAEMGAATGLIAVGQQISTVAGIGITTQLLRLFSTGPLDIEAIRSTIFAIAAISFCSVIILIFMPRDAGRNAVR